MSESLRCLSGPHHLGRNWTIFVFPEPWDQKPAYFFRFPDAAPWFLSLSSCTGCGNSCPQGKTLGSLLCSFLFSKILALNISLPLITLFPQPTETLGQHLFFFLNIVLNKRVLFVLFVTIKNLNFKQILGLGTHTYPLIQLSTCLIPRSFSRTAALTMELHEFSQFKCGLLQHFDFSNEDIMEQRDRLASLFCFFSRAIWNQFIDHFFQVICLHFSGHDFHFLLLDLADLLILSIRGLPNLIAAFLSKPTQNRRIK